MNCVTNVLPMKRKEPKLELVYDYKHQAEKTGLGTVWVRCYFSRTQRKYVSTGVRVAPEEWSNRWGVIRREDAAVLNKQILEQREECKKMMATAIENNMMMDGKTMKKVKGAVFLDYLAEQIMRAPIAASTKKHHETTYRLLEEYGKITRFEHITPKNIEAWLNWIAQRGVNRLRDGKLHNEPIVQTTIYDHWKRLRKYIRMAQADGKVAWNAVASVKVKRGQSKDREHLTDEEYKTWCNARIRLEYLKAARDRFVVQMGTGLSFADMMAMDFTKHEEVDGLCVLSGIRRKTGKRYFVVIMPEAVKVLKRWRWKVPKISNTNYNIYLNRVAILCGIEKHITSHVGRHTYACQCLSHGVRLEAVQRTLGHSNIKTTQIYARMMDMDVVNAFKDAKGRG